LPIALVLFFWLIIIFVPWTQTVTVTGQMSAYTPYERPQDIEAQITGRIKKWHVFEGDKVKQGDLILELEDNDPNFMSPDLLAFLDQRKSAQEKTKSAALARVEQLDKRISEMRNLVKAAIPSAEARVVEAGNRVREAHQKVEAAKMAQLQQLFTSIGTNNSSREAWFPNESWRWRSKQIPRVKPISKGHRKISTQPNRL
jgi:multidrug efflux pump subunit AcrA (membrane-fusion protein)